MFRFSSNASSRIENAFSDLIMPFQRFYECLLLELEMPPTILRMLIEGLKVIFEELKNASHALRMLFEELKMLLTL